MEGEKISFSNDNIVIKDYLGNTKHKSTCHRIFSLFIVGDFTMTSGLIRNARKFGFPIVLFTQSFKPYEFIGNATEGNFLLRKAQYDYGGMEIAKTLVGNKVKNQIAVLRKQRDSGQRMKDALRVMESYVDSIGRHEGDSVSLMGIEGSASRVYFANNFNNVDWIGRMPRSKKDYVNSVLDIGYTILQGYVESFLKLFGFDVYWGVYHRLFYMRKSLACDLVEPFRPLIDWEVRKAINLGQFKESHFNDVGGRKLLNFEYNRDYVRVFMKPLLERKEDFYRYFRNYYRAFINGKFDEMPEFVIS